MSTKIRKTLQVSKVFYLKKHLQDFSLVRFGIYIKGMQLGNLFEKCSEPWPTKYTAVYVTFEGQNLRGQLFKRTQQSNRGQKIV